MNNQVAINGEYLFEFNSFSQWVDKASSWCKPYTRHDKLVMVDMKGNICLIGEDFVIAKENNLFPVKVYRLIRTIENYKNQTTMKTYKAITVNGEMTLKRMPEIERPKAAKGNLYKINEAENYLQHLADIESEPIIKVAPEYIGFWKEGNVVSEDEFEIKSLQKNEVTWDDISVNMKSLMVQFFAIPKPKEDEGETLAFSDLLEMANLLPPEDFMHYVKQHYSITKKTTTP